MLDKCDVEDVYNGPMCQDSISVKDGLLCQIFNDQVGATCPGQTCLFKFKKLA